MPAFLIKDLDCVFIHNPKTGGQALRELLLAGDHEGPVTGPLPAAWGSRFCFSFVRNPFDRLVSAWKMFSQGIDDTGWKVPLDLERGMGLPDFLRIVMDESIEFGPGDRSGRVRIRNHTLPQTHEFYSLDQADWIGRFENYAADVTTIFAKIGFDSPPPEPKHVTERGPYQQYFDAESRRLAATYYAEDLARFGYSFEAQDFGGAP